MPQVPDSVASVEAVRIARTSLAGEDACVLMVGSDNRCLYASPLAAPLAAALADLDAPPLSAEMTTLRALLAAARRNGRAATGTVGAFENRLARVFDLTAVPCAGAEHGDDVILLIGRDVTLVTSMRRTLMESRQRYKDLVEVSAAFAWETNTDGTLVFVSPQGVLGYGVDELVGRKPASFLAEPLESGATLPFSARQPVADVEVWMRRAEGSAVCLLVSAVPLYDDAGRWTGARGVCRDITDVRERDIAIARSRNRERLLSFIVRSFRDEVDPENMLAIAAATVAQGVGVSGCNVLRVPRSASRSSRSATTSTSSRCRAPIPSPACSTAAPSSRNSNAAPSACATRAASPRCSTSTSTTSRPSTTCSATSGATRRCSRSSACSRRRPARATWWRASAATSSRCGWTAWTRPWRWRRRAAC